MTLEVIRQQLRNLAPLAEEINAASDIFTDELRVLEAELNELNLGVDVTLEPPLIPEDDRNEEDGFTFTSPYTCLAYARYGTEWRIVLRAPAGSRKTQESSGAVGSKVTSSTGMKPLLEASRELRIAAAGRIGELIALIETESRRQLESLNAAADQYGPDWSGSRIAMGTDGFVHLMKGTTAESICGRNDHVHWNSNRKTTPRCPKCRLLDFQAIKADSKKK